MDSIDVDAQGISVRVSSPDKVYFPALGLTKSDIVDYVLAVGEPLLAAVLNRPTTMERWPGGVHDHMVVATRADARGDAFYQKRVPKGAPEWVQQATITFPSGRTAQAVAPNNLATLVWMVNLGTLRFHAWPVRASDTDRVDQLRLDLDPQPGTDFSDAVKAAFDLREVLADAGLEGWCKTSGGRGVHVYVPVEGVDFIDARHAAIALGRELVRRAPERVTLNWWKEERGQRVFLDYNQMARDRLMASSYSIRPVAEARVSMPLDWDELGQVHPDDFTVASVPRLVASRGDAWAGLYQASPRSLRTALAWFERDAQAGEGELVYPPEYPKMPGEPPRVQPSRAKDRTQ